jgi:hypothetical protein
MMEDLEAEFSRRGFAKTTVSSVLSKLKSDGKIAKSAEGVWSKV